MEQNLSISGLENGVWEIILDRGEKANALSQSLVSQIHAAIKQLAASEARVVILRSKGNVFCSGFDFGGYKSMSVGDLLLRFVEIELMLQDLRQAPFLSIAYIDGPAFGAGADIAMACTWRVGTKNSKFRFPGFQFGLALGTRHLTSIVGIQKTRNILLLNQSIGADQAVSLGMLTELLDADSFQEGLSRIIQKIENLDAQSMSRISAMTIENSNQEDLFDLVHSIIYGNLHDRIANYLGTKHA